MVPVIFAMNLFGHKLAWSDRRKVHPPQHPCAAPCVSDARLLQLCFTLGVPLSVALFLFVWHAVRGQPQGSCMLKPEQCLRLRTRPQGLGQPGLLRATVMGQAVYYGLSTLCFVQISASRRRMFGSHCLR